MNRQEGYSMVQQLLCSVVVISLISAVAPATRPATQGIATIWGPTKEGCRIRLSCPKTHYRFGEIIQIDAEVQNVDRQHLSIELGSSGFLYESVVFLPNGITAPPTLFMRESLVGRGLAGGSAINIDLGKGQSSKSRLDGLNRWFDMTLPGRYKVKVWRDLPSKLDPEATVYAVSNDVEIIVD